MAKYIFIKDYTIRGNAPSWQPEGIGDGTMDFDFKKGDIVEGTVEWGKGDIASSSLRFQAKGSSFNINLTPGDSPLIEYSGTGTSIGIGVNNSSSTFWTPQVKIIGALAVIVLIIAIVKFWK